jgi:hypothetical protein
MFKNILGRSGIFILPWKIQMLKKDLLLPNLFGPLWKIMMLEIFRHSRNFYATQ